MNQQNPITFAQAGASQAGWQGASAPSSGQSKGSAPSASVLAAQWQSALRPATVPLLPSPSFETATPAPSVATAAGAVASPARSATLALPPPADSAPVVPDELSKADGMHGVLVAVLSVVLVLLVLYLIAGPFGARVGVLHPLHHVLAGFLHRG